MLRRVVGLVLDQDLNADWAALIAEETSEREAEDEAQICLWEEGEITGKVVVVMTSSPLMRRGTVYSDIFKMDTWKFREDRQ